MWPAPTNRFIEKQRKEQKSASRAASDTLIGHTSLIVLRFIRLCMSSGSFWSRTILSRYRISMADGIGRRSACVLSVLECRCIWHLLWHYLGVAPRVAHGMECVRSRHTIAEAALSELRLNVKTADAPHVSHIRRSVMRTAAPPLDPVAFMHCDATARECLAYSHIFMSDSSFSSLTLCKLALVSTRLPHMEENSLLLLTGACHAA